MTTTSGPIMVGVLGAGAMGTGIAQVAAAAGHKVVLADASMTAVARARNTITQAMRREIEKGRLSEHEAHAVMSRVRYSETIESLDAYRDCGLVIEAIIERADAK